MRCSTRSSRCGAAPPRPPTGTRATTPSARSTATCTSRAPRGTTGCGSKRCRSATRGSGGAASPIGGCGRSCPTRSTRPATSTSSAVTSRSPRRCASTPRRCRSGSGADRHDRMTSHAARRCAARVSDALRPPRCTTTRRSLAPLPEEEPLIARSVAKRRNEFVTVRYCARQALGDLGLPPVPILKGDKGEPCWPDGVVGSLTHCEGFRGAVVGRRAEVRSVGIDAEPHDVLPHGRARRDQPAGRAAASCSAARRRCTGTESCSAPRRRRTRRGSR